MIFKNPTFIALIIPILFLITGSFSKKIVRGTQWKTSDFYLGIESTLASLTAGLIYIYDLVKEMGNNPKVNFSERLISTTSFSIVSFFLVLFVIATHQNWESRNNNPGLQFFFLGLICNLIGIGLMISFILVIKGI